MTNRKLLKHAYIATLCEHTSAQAYQDRVFAVQNLDELAKQLEDAGEKITKADFFTGDEQGLRFLDSASGWRNFDKIIDIVEKNGEKFEAEDFLQVVGHRGRTFLDSAGEHDALDKIFQAKLWMGNFKAVEKLYYEVPTGRRSLFRDEGRLLNIKREIAAAEGREIREDQLARLSIDWKDFPRMFSQPGGIERLRMLTDQLERNGEKLTKEDVLLTDHEGDTLFYKQEVWEHFTEIQSMLARNGEALDVADYIEKKGSRPSILERACENGALDKVFDPQFWAGRLSSMVELWEHLLPMEKSDLGHDEFARLLNKAENLTYGDVFNVDDVKNIKDLTQPIAIEGDAKVFPLSLDTVWDNIDDLMERLAKNKQSIKMQHMRQISGCAKKPIFEMAIKNGHLDKLIKVAKKSGEGFAVEDLLKKDDSGMTMLDVIGHRKQLSTLFDPELWAGRISDMKALWSQVPINQKSQLDWGDVLNRTNVCTLQQSSKKSDTPRLKRRRK
ncbi:MAG: hypothetical protein ACQEQL_05480 [Pseudomonadota bacterium]